jgi:hypothetical protein
MNNCLLLPRDKVIFGLLKLLRYNCCEGSTRFLKKQKYLKNTICFAKKRSYIWRGNVVIPFASGAEDHEFKTEHAM